MTKFNLKGHESHRKGSDTACLEALIIAYSENNGPVSAVQVMKAGKSKEN